MDHYRRHFELERAIVPPAVCERLPEPDPAQSKPGQRESWLKETLRRAEPAKTAPSYAKRVAEARGVRREHAGRK